MYSTLSTVYILSSIFEYSKEEEGEGGQGAMYCVEEMLHYAQIVVFCKQYKVEYNDVYHMLPSQQEEIPELSDLWVFHSAYNGLRRNNYCSMLCLDLRSGKRYVYTNKKDSQ
jgi:hypothetical protein